MCTENKLRLCTRRPGTACHDEESELIHIHTKDGKGVETGHTFNKIKPMKIVLRSNKEILFFSCRIPIQWYNLSCSFVS